MRAIALCLLLTACGGVASMPPPVSQGVAWAAGPIINGKDYSPGVSVSGDSVSIPKGAELDAIIRNVATAPATMSFNYSVSGELRPSEAPSEGAFMTVMFQRQGDDWSGNGEYEFYRWYSKDVFPLTQGMHSGSVDFTDPAKWISVFGHSGADYQTQFRDALAHISNIEFVFGRAGAGRGHGVIAPQGATITFKENTTPVAMAVGGMIAESLMHHIAITRISFTGRTFNPVDNFAVIVLPRSVMFRARIAF